MTPSVRIVELVADFKARLLDSDSPSRFLEEFLTENLTLTDPEVGLLARLLIRELASLDMGDCR